jgi:hypothetical protein
MGLGVGVWQDQLFGRLTASAALMATAHNKATPPPRSGWTCEMGV